MATKKVMISLPEEALARIDAEARRLGLTRSAYLQANSAPTVGRPSRAELEEILARGRARMVKAGPIRAEEMIRLDRDERSVRDGRRNVGDFG